MKFETLYEKLSHTFSPLELADIEKAYRLAEKSHGGQKRASGEPYITHCIAVAKILDEMNMPAPVIIAGLLHDVVEDTTITLDDLRNKFGDEVTRLVDGVTKLTNLPGVSRVGKSEGESVLSPEEIENEKRIDQRTRDREAETLRKTILAMMEDAGVVLIKLADRLHNMRTLKHLSPERQKRMARETLEIFAPLANRLGIWKMKWELEDLAFRYAEPEKYREIARLLDERRAEREEKMGKIIEQIKTKLSANHVDLIEVDGRPKHIYSIYRKMQRKQDPFERIYDVRAVRVIVKDVAACYVTLGLIHSLWKSQPREFDDYISLPKENNYQSLHTAVIYDDGKPLEVQIRTPEMHENSEYGVAAHWRYKEGGKQDVALDQRISHIRQMMEWRQDVTEGRAFVEALKSDVFEDRVYIFTPKGDIVDLPQGSTPIDFAFHVHSSVGERCRGAKVNGRLVALDKQLKSGDSVEIITANRGGPSRDWINPDLGYVKSARAREKIRNWFKKQDREQNIAAGRGMLERELKRLGIDHITYDEIAEIFNRKTEEFLLALGCGDIHSQTVVNRVVERIRESRAEEEDFLPPLAPQLKPTLDSDEITIQGAGGMLTRTASCCNPVKGDPIIGFVTRNRGVTIHRRDCRDAVNIRETERLIDVSWGGASARTFAVPIRVRAYDRDGLLKDVSTIVANEKVSINQVSVPTVEDNMANILLTLQVTDLTQLTRILNRIEQLSNVLDVRRWKST